LTQQTRRIFSTYYAPYQTIGDIAASCQVPLASFEPTFHLEKQLPVAGMFHRTNGRKDNDALADTRSEGEVQFAKV
jgi:hypothetical protein